MVWEWNLPRLPPLNLDGIPSIFYRASVKREPKKHSEILTKNQTGFIRGKAGFLLALFLICSLPAHARLGWTLAECEAKYGKAKIAVPTGRQVKGSSVEATFKYEGWRIRVAWFEGTDKAQFILYTSDAPKMTNEQLDAILKSNSEGQKWVPHFDGQNKAGVAISSAFSGADMRSGYFQREDGARTGTIMLWAINNVSIKTAWLYAWEKRNEAVEAAKKSRVPNL